jgi:hypothetical protein
MTRASTDILIDRIPVARNLATDASPIQLPLASLARAYYRPDLCRPP